MQKVGIKCEINNQVFLVKTLFELHKMTTLKTRLKKCRPGICEKY